ncbi:hypothetical protein WNY51_16515 [Pseudocolwellia sp. AS88]|uniref:hypothetical protein n=1 Tax=Pseudocolwellia sp. AS88 TaxID=3063958 RepID=UPI0026F289B9|nr:hypothetical protein [Pseudocolwellia sp. AS88]MDO7085029.1 hypothetical protein [Pseudocolwellia sp. AS88]
MLNIKSGIFIMPLSSYSFLTRIISGKAVNATLSRCKRLRIDRVINSCKGKHPKIKEIGAEYSIYLKKMAFSVNNILYLQIFQHIEPSYTPANIHPFSLKKSSWITKPPDGRLMVCEFVDKQLSLQKKKSLEEINTLLINKIIKNNIIGVEQ